MNPALNLVEPVLSAGDRHHPRVIAGYLAHSSEIAQKFRKLRRHSSHIKSSSYDISRECNLTCEGCLFFEGEDFVKSRPVAAASGWDALFATEVRRGINYPFMAGAEPALARDVLRVARTHFTRGMIFTNGTVPIDPDLPFTIHVSLWGAPEESAKLRGGGHFARSLNNFKNDERARFILTLNRTNISSARRVAQICSDHGTKLSFNLFSPTTLYLNKIQAGSSNGDDYFRFSNADDNLMLKAADLAMIREELAGLIPDYPDTLIYTDAFNDFVTNPEGLYEIDPATGWAKNCQTRQVGYHWHFRTDLSSTGAKCCTPNIDCSQCRLYPIALGTAVNRFPVYLDTYESFRRWVIIADQWSRLFLHDWDQLDEAP